MTDFVSMMQASIIPKVKVMIEAEKKYLNILQRKQKTVFVEELILKSTLYIEHLEQRHKEYLKYCELNISCSNTANY